jgi:hypothetical protein
MDSLELSPTPVGEECAQVGAENYHAMARKECNAFIKQLRRQFGVEPYGARLYVKSNPHDFGSYLEVACKFDENEEEAVEYAYKLESNLPENWDEEAKLELEGPQGGPLSFGAVLRSK